MLPNPLQVLLVGCLRSLPFTASAATIISEMQRIPSVKYCGAYMH